METKRRLAIVIAHGSEKERNRALKLVMPWAYGRLSADAEAWLDGVILLIAGRSPELVPVVNDGAPPVAICSTHGTQKELWGAMLVCGECVSSADVHDWDGTPDYERVEEESDLDSLRPTIIEGLVPIILDANNRRVR